MSEVVTPKGYLLALCTALQESGESLGVAVRIGSSTSMFNVEAIKVIRSILTFSPAPDSMAIEFLNELAKVSGMEYLVAPCLTCQSDPTTWATEVMNFLSTNFLTDEIKKHELEPITNLASEMLSHLLIATRNPGGEKTPQESVHSSLDVAPLREIQDLLNDATTNSCQSSLKDLLFWRDGYSCPVTGMAFARPGRFVKAQAAHILPYSFHDKAPMLSALERFSGRQLSEEVKRNINHPCNAFNAEANAHDAYDDLVWGIEAIQVGNEWKYYFRIVRPEEIPPTINLGEGQDFFFGRGESAGQIIAKPNPEYCNLKLAMNACGVADIIAYMYGDDEAIYLGGPFVSDGVFFRRVDDRLLT